MMGLMTCNPIIDVDYQRDRKTLGLETGIRFVSRRATNEDRRSAFRRPCQMTFFD